MLLETGPPQGQNYLSYALIGAAHEGQKEACAMLLAHGAKLTGIGRQALQAAAAVGQADVCKLLLAHGPQEGVDISHALVAAARKGHAEVCKVLLQAGASPSSVHVRGETALQAAAEAGSVEVCELLLKQPGIHARQAEVSAALDSALERGQYPVCLLLLLAKSSAAGRRGSLLKLAAETGDAWFFQLLLQCLRYTVWDLCCALGAAAKLGNYKICRQILNRVFELSGARKTGA